MILEVVADARQVNHNVNSRRLKEAGLSHAASLQDLRRVDSSRRDDDLKVGGNGADVSLIGRTNGLEFDGGGRIRLANDETGDLVSHKQVVVGAILDDLEVMAASGMRALAINIILGSGDPADAVLVAAGALRWRGQAHFDKGVPGNLCKDARVKEENRDKEMTSSRSLGVCSNAVHSLWMGN